MSKNAKVKTVGIIFMAASFFGGCGIGDLGGPGVTGHATGSSQNESELVLSYDRNFVQHCIERDNNSINQCILEAACQNMDSQVLGKIFKHEVYRGMELTARGEPFYWDDVADKGDGAGLLLLNNLCADFHYWRPSKEHIELPNGVEETRNTTAPGSDPFQPGEVDHGESRGVLEGETGMAERSGPPRVKGFDVAGSIHLPPVKNREIIVPICKGRACMEPKYWARGTYISRESCAENFGKKVLAIHGTKKVVEYMVQKNCQWIPDNDE